jgi:hypothetical protein
MNEFSDIPRLNSNATRSEGLPAEIVVKQLNRTLSTVYCASDDCVQRHGTNFTYRIPISPTLPPMSITLQFRFVVGSLMVPSSVELVSTRETGINSDFKSPDFWSTLVPCLCDWRNVNESENSLVVLMSVSLLFPAFVTGEM